MKKLYFFALAAFVAMMGLTACGDDNDQLTDSRLTHYVVLELQGNSTEEVILGSSYYLHGYQCRRVPLVGDPHRGRLRPHRHGRHLG